MYGTQLRLFLQDGMMILRTFSAVLMLLSTSLLFSQEAAPVQEAMVKRPMNVEDLFAFQRVGAPNVSPDGKWVGVSIVAGSDRWFCDATATDQSYRER